MSENVIQFTLEKDELRFIALAVATALENIAEARLDKDVKWTDQSLKDFDDMSKAGKSIVLKLINIGFDPSLPSYQPGDEKEFIKP